MFHSKIFAIAWALSILLSLDTAHATNSSPIIIPARLTIDMPERLNHLKFSPDSATYAINQSNDIVIADTSTGKTKLILKGHSKGIKGISFSPDSKLLATSSVDGTIRLWNLASGTQVRVIDVGIPLREVAFGSVGRSVSTIDRYGKVSNYSTANGELLNSFDRQAKDVGFYKYSPDGSMLAIGGKNNVIELWDVASGFLKISSPQTTPAKFVHTDSMAFSGDGKSIIISSGREIKLWDLRLNKLNYIDSFAKFEPLDIALNESGSSIALSFRAGDYYAIWIFSMPNAPMGALDSMDRIQLLRVPGGSIVAIDFSKDGKYIGVAENLLSNVHLWDTASGGSASIQHENRHAADRKRAQLSDSQSGVGFEFTHEKGILLSLNDEFIDVWNIDRRLIQERIPYIRTGGNKTSSNGLLKITPNGQTLITSGKDNALRFWNFRSKQITAVIERSNRGEFISEPSVGSQGATIAFINKRFFTNHTTSNIELKSIPDGRSILELEAASSESNPMAPITQSLAYDDRSNEIFNCLSSSIRVLDSKTGNLKRTLSREFDTHCQIVLAPSGRQIAHVSNRNNVKLLDAGNGAEIGAIDSGFGEAVSAITFSADGSLIAVGYGDDFPVAHDSIVVYSLAEKNILYSIPALQAGGVRAMKFSEDGSMLVTSDAQGIRLWNAKTGEPWK